MKLLLFVPLLALACLFAAVYGALNNQISYGISPEYFHEFKFLQFDIPSEWQNEIGAALVGVLASWWMGLIVGVPIALIGLFVRGTSSYVHAYIQAAFVVIAVTLIVGLGAAFLSFLSFTDPGLIAMWKEGGVSDPITFNVAATLHNFSYLGGLIGLIIGTGLMIRAAVRSRRTPSIDVVD